MKINKGYRRAKAQYWKRAYIASILDSIMSFGASFLHICGEGKRNNWSVLLAQLFYTKCPCCLFYRGVTIGTILTVTLALLFWII